MPPPVRVAIVGAAGYLGSYLHDSLRWEGHDVTGYDTRARAGCERVRGADIPAHEVQAYDVVVYLAGLSGRAACRQTTWDAVHHENVGDIRALAEKLLPSQLLVYASSASVVEGHVRAPVDETCTVNVGKLDAYARSMYEREQALRGLGTNSIGLRLGTVIGVSPSQRHDLLHISMARAAINTGTVRVVNGSCWRGVLALRELGDAVAAIIARRPSNGPAIYHLASFNTTIEAAAQAVAAQACADVVHDDAAGGEADAGFALDTARFCADFGFRFAANNETLAEGVVAAFQAGRTPCRVCKSPHMAIVTDLGPQPLANNYVDTPRHQPRYPLVLTRCPACFHTQQDTTVPPEAMFATYQYTSGTSRTLREYFGWLAELAIAESGKAAGGTVLELACNDGFQLDEFAKRGWVTYGVDPASNLVPIARGKGHAVFCQFWGTDPPPAGVPTPDLIVAQNVLAHVPDPIAFLVACARTMGPDTLLYIQTSQCNMYENGEFDTIYHEHLSFFTAASMQRAAEEAGLTITRARKTPIHGTSFLFTMALPRPDRGHHASLHDLVAAERAAGLHSPRFFKAYKQRIYAVREWVRETLEQARREGYGTVAFGAAAKGMTLLNLFALEGIEYIVDDAPMKQGMFTPGTNIPILAPSRLGQDTRRLAILVLAWNFADEIAGTISSLRRRPTRLILPFPAQTTTELKCDAKAH